MEINITLSSEPIQDSTQTVITYLDTAVPSDELDLVEEYVTTELGMDIDEFIYRMIVGMAEKLGVDKG